MTKESADCSLSLLLSDTVLESQLLLTCNRSKHITKVIIKDLAATDWSVIGLGDLNEQLGDISGPKLFDTQIKNYKMMQCGKLLKTEDITNAQMRNTGLAATCSTGFK